MGLDKIVDEKTPDDTQIDNNIEYECPFCEGSGEGNHNKMAFCRNDICPIYSFSPKKYNDLKEGEIDIEDIQKQDGD